MSDDFPNQLRKQFPIDRVYETPDFVMAVYVNERDHAADIIEDQQKRIEKLEAALLNIYDKWENGVGICDVIDAMDAARAALGEKKDV
jgi:hypothetical protein